MQADQAQPPEERVRRALAHLGVDSASAPPVPATVTARIGAALRAAPPAHATRPLPRLSGRGVITLLVGIGAVGAAVAVGVTTLLQAAPASRFPSGPTAEHITVSVPISPGDTPKAVVTRP